AWFVGQIVGGSPTAIFGSITANGQVALVNRQGVIFGETASINAAGVFASALGLTDQDIFQKEGAVFEAESGVGGYVINHGVISASVGGSVTLLGESVTNTGVIVATLGQVNLASGSKAVVNFGPDQLIGIEVTEEVLENNESLKAAISNTGTIDAPGGKVMLTSSVSRSLFDHAINNEGVIRAKDAQYENGVIKLFGSGGSVVNTGQIDASSSADGVAGGQITISSDTDVLLSEQSSVLATSESDVGGSVDITADSVTIEQGSVLNVSGDLGGGSISVAATDFVTLDVDSELRADAIGSGDGGTVNVAAESVSLAGEISARGGAESGDGGEVRVSAGSSLTLTGSVDVSASQGVDGTVILSAPALEVSDAGQDGQVDLNSVVGNIELEAAQRVVINNVVESILDLGDADFSVTVVGAASSAEAADAIGFVMADARDALETTGQVTIGVRDSSLNANALIDVAGRIESRPFPSPLPNDPLGPSNTIALTATNGRIRIRNSAELRAVGLDGNAGSVSLLTTGFEEGNDAGTVYFEGSIDVTSEAGVGGSVKMLGDRVGLFAEAEIDASGQLGGGEVLVGGDFQGKGSTYTAERTTVDSGAQVKADATGLGDGGRVIIWADDTTRFSGSIFARGGLDGGDGGFAEVSGKSTLVFAGMAHLGATLGSSGSLLLDPQNITIQDSGAEPDLVGATGDDADANTYAFAEDAASSVTIDADVLTTI
ncbi:MAG: filamentous hemagglutinin N-terminal domain-containing protein, partial [Pseudomonadales bacterium]